VSWDYNLNVGENHQAAAQAWLDKHIEDSHIAPPGLNFDDSFYWTWDFNLE
jgi:hypothetical protein